MAIVLNENMKIKLNQLAKLETLKLKFLTPITFHPKKFKNLS